MKLSLIFAAALTAATGAQAQDIGGTISATYGSGTVNETDSSIDTWEGSYSRRALNGSIGIGMVGGFGFQVDGGYETGKPSGDDYYTATAYTAHANLPVGSYRLGVFAGAGKGDHLYDDDFGDVRWYGIEGVRDFGAGSLAAQIGRAEHSNSHNALDYSAALLAQVEYRHFVHDNFMIRGNFGLGDFVTHGDPGRGYLLSAEAVYGVTNNVYLTAGLRDFIVKNDGEGSYTDLSANVGITFAFGGGGSLRKTMSTTPMIASTLPSLIAVASSAVD